MNTQVARLLAGQLSPRHVARSPGKVPPAPPLGCTAAGRVCKGQGDKRTLSECPDHAPSYRVWPCSLWGRSGEGSGSLTVVGERSTGIHLSSATWGVPPDGAQRLPAPFKNPFCSVLGTAEGPRGRGASPWWVQEAREGGWRLLGTARLSSQVSASFWKLPQGSPPKSRLRGRSWSVPGPGPRGFR